MQDAVLAAFLVVDDELHRDMRAARPFRIRRIGAVAAHVACVTHCRSIAAIAVIRIVERIAGAFPRKFLKVFLQHFRSTADLCMAFN